MGYFGLYHVPAWIIALTLLVGIFCCFMLGERIGNYRKKKFPHAKAEGVGPLEGALLGLLALLLSFTFSMSAARYEKRLTTTTEEAGDIHTAVLRADLYPDSIRAEFRKDFQQYVEARIAYHTVGSSEAKTLHALKDAEHISGRIWQRATSLSRSAPNVVMPHSMMIQALNGMIDAVHTREVARLARVPDLILWLLIILTLLGSMIIGYSKKESGKDWVVLTIYALMTVITIYTVIDLDRPRRGFIKTDIAHEKIFELRELFENDAK